jgi:superfamily II DNA or RNA helicase
VSRAADFILKLAKLKEKVKLRQHQEDAVDYVLEGDGSALLAHGTGSGKTLSAIAAFEKLRELNKAKRALVLTPASLQDNFETEGVGKFTDSQVSRGVDGKSPYQIMSYSKFRRDPHRYLQESKADTVIADEVHRAKDKQSVTYRALRTASNYVDNFIGLTGSPISNHPREIVPLMDLVAPTHDLGSQQGFQKRHTKREMYDKGGFLRGPKFRTELQRKVELSGKVKGKVHYLGHEDLTQDMPGLDIREIHTEMTPEQTKLYNFALGKLTPRQRRLIRDGLPASQSEAQHILSAIMKARQASNSVGTHKNIPLHQAAEETPKLKQVMDDVQEHLRNTSDGQAVIYTNLVQGGADALYAGLKKRGLNPGLFAGVGALGEVTKDSRQKAVEDFRSGKKNVILLTPAAGEGVSLNNATFFAEVDRHYNPERNQQAIARGRRLGGLAHRPKSNRVLEVRRYYSDPKPNWFRRMLGQTEMGVDSWIQTVADEKDRLNKDFREVVKTASELPTQEEIFSLLSKKLPQGVQHVSGGLADTKGVSDVDGGMYHEDHTNLLHQFPEGTEISEQSPEGTVYSIPGYQRDVNI